MWEMWKLTLDSAAVASAATVQPIEEDKEEEDEEVEMGEGSPTKYLAPKQVPAPQATVPVKLEFWAASPSD